MRAQMILEPLEPEKSNDPETLGLSGAIYKRLWSHNNDPATLDQAIQYYEKGFELRGDYYNGENAATCIEVRAGLQEDENEALYDRMTAKKIRTTIVKELLSVADSAEFAERSDQVWVYATLANCLFALGQNVDAQKFETLFFEEKPADWQQETYQTEKDKVLKVHKPEG